MRMAVLQYDMIIKDVFGSLSVDVYDIVLICEAKSYNRLNKQCPKMQCALV